MRSKWIMPWGSILRAITVDANGCRFASAIPRPPQRRPQSSCWPRHSTDLHGRPWNPAKTRASTHTWHWRSVQSMWIISYQLTTSYIIYNIYHIISRSSRIVGVNQPLGSQWTSRRKSHTSCLQLNMSVLGWTVMIHQRPDHGDCSLKEQVRHCETTERLTIGTHPKNKPSQTALNLLHHDHFQSTYASYIYIYVLHYSLHSNHQ